MPENVIVLGAGTYQVGLINYLKGEGYYVHVVTNRPDETGVSMADRVHLFDYMSSEKVVALARESAAIQVFSAASDVAILSEVFVQKQMDWHGYDLRFVSNFVDKIQYKKWLRTAGISTPEMVLWQSQEMLDSLLARWDHGVVGKPGKGSGSNGVFWIRPDQSDNLPACPAVGADYILEAYLPGPEFGGDFVVLNGELFFFYPTVKSKNQYWVPTGHLMVRNVPNLEAMTQTLSHMVNTLSFPDGVYNVDMIVSDGQPYIIDLSPRLGGNCIPDLVQNVWKINEWQFLTELRLGKPVTAPRPVWQQPCGVHIFGAEKEGRLGQQRHLQFSQLSDVTEVYWRVSPGDMVETFDQGGKHLGYVLYKAESDDTLLEMQEKVAAYQWFTLA